MTRYTEDDIGVGLTFMILHQMNIISLGILETKLNTELVCTILSPKKENK